MQGCQTGGLWSGYIMHRPCPPPLRKDKKHRATSWYIMQQDQVWHLWPDAIWSTVMKIHTFKTKALIFDRKVNKFKLFINWKKHLIHEVNSCILVDYYKNMEKLQIFKMQILIEMYAICNLLWVMNICQKKQCIRLCFWLLCYVYVKVGFAKWKNINRNERPVWKKHFVIHIPIKRMNENRTVKYEGKVGQEEAWEIAIRNWGVKSGWLCELHLTEEHKKFHILLFNFCSISYNPITVCHVQI